jgi:hydrophobic/amphiphilic exporter-1 (mainly G- bacteria), HAE1 family
MKLADISIARPVFAIMLITSLVVFGLVSYPRIGVDLFPNVEFPVVTVTVTYPGADPASMESKIADPLEESINTLNGIKELRSVNLESVTQIIVNFELEVPIDRAVQDVRDKVSASLHLLPQNVDPPVIEKFDVGAAPIMALSVAGNLAPRELTRIAKDVVKERVQRISGVGSVELVGGRERELHVLIDPAKLAGTHLTVHDLVSALQAQNLEMPAGHIDIGQREFAVKTKGEVRNAQEIADILVSGIGGARIRIGDVARVEDGAEEERSYSAMNGVAAVALVVRKSSGSNTVEVARHVKDEVEKMRASVAKMGAKISVPTDNAPFIEHSIADVQFDLAFGAFLAVIVILFFLHNFRATVISALAIPTSVIATFAFIKVMGFTFNNMTMLALSLSIGILIDDAIVVIENIHRHLEMGKKPLQAAQNATQEIGLAVLATTMSIVAVFVPVAFMKGIVGRFFYQFGLTVSFAVLVSLLVSFTLTPMLASRFLHVNHNKKGLGGFQAKLENILGKIDSSYRALLAKALDHRGLTLGIAFVALILSFALVSQVKTEFIPPEDRSQFEVDVELPAGTSLDMTKRFAQPIADDLRHAPGVLGTFVTVGGGAQAKINLARIQVILTPRNERSFHQFDLMAWVRERYAKVKEANITVNIIDAIGGNSGFRSQPVQFNIRGKDMDELVKASNALIAELKKVPGFVDLDTSYRGGNPELSIEINRDRAAELGIPIAMVATTLRALVAGDKVSDLKDGLDLFDITMRLPDDLKSGLERLDFLMVRSSQGQLIPLSNVVKVVRGEGPTQIERQARQRQITVFAGLEKIPLGDATKIVDAKAAQVVPASLTTDYAGMAQVMGESFGYMGFALFMAVVIVYMILASQFDSFVHPFTIMLSLPLSVIGAFGGLFVTRMTLNIFSMIGVIMLMGLVTKNAILLVDFANHARQQGKNTKEALLEAGSTRLRPIVMTTLAMIFGMLPVALALGEGGETRAPMAVTVIGGLITSTLLTLVVVPVVYLMLDNVLTSGPLLKLQAMVFKHHDHSTTNA